MGNCTSGQKNQVKGHTDDKTETDTENEPKEDVTYATVDHSTNVSRRPHVSTEESCLYVTVNIPPAPQPEPESDCSSREDGADDYVLMM